MNQEEMAVFVKHWPGFLSVRDSNHRFRYLNNNFLIWLGSFGVTNPVGFTAPELAKVAPDNVASMLLACHDASLEYLDIGVSIPKVIEFKGINGSEYYQVMKFKGEVDGRTCIFTTGFDVTKLQLSTKFYQMKSQTDSLTGLNNKEALKRLDICEGIAIVIDLNNFKSINDSLGHTAGDEALISFSKLLRENFRDDDFIARIGGDEFLVVAKGLTETTALFRLDALADKFELEFKRYPNFGWAYGIAPISKNWEETFNTADANMYRNKNESKIRLCSIY
ncbi:GGDEF domain-containing protein [Vibrio parahaemolyticus]|uniref:diguanylate cyclase n=2 Tax=Vibrio harveyi group TaxID=717610 RepID=A0A9Q3U9W5_VIBPH|nr:GGDEF domain-containing protein [Vibrio parahaemolyticus]ELA8176553.1 GGDEF domain-containing protein [Vibrio alginolyticus]CAH1598306.1 GGDEF domain-containing protein [Vibrio jasicida]EGQ9742322.1 GGDEF domain-containing protein [Vibrio parahaemolyticus]EJC7175987.1 GGDEF domain-containing protein [Vibrio parahaemolyticus]EJE4724426.1 GGDEF domain-containing protein [Vibrio parahaemolyticus]